MNKGLRREVTCKRRDQGIQELQSSGPSSGCIHTAGSLTGALATRGRCWHECMGVGSHVRSGLCLGLSRCNPAAIFCQLLPAQHTPAAQ